MEGRKGEREGEEREDGITHWIHMVNYNYNLIFTCSC